MEAAEILGRVGVLGFVSVFQAIGVAAARAVLTAARRALRGGTLAKEAVGFVLGLVFSLFFVGVPLAMAAEFAGWPGLVAQIAILGTLVGFVFTPHPPERAVAVAEAPRGWLNRIVARPPAPQTPPGPWRRLLSAAPALAVAAGCAAAAFGHPLLGMTRDGLCHLVKIEFLVIHSFPFLSLITLPRLGWRRWRIFQWFLFATWSCLYLAFAMEGEHALSGLIGFASGAIVTYLGFLLRLGAGNRISNLVKRWGVSFALFMAAAMLAGSRNPRVSETTLWHGAIYFVALGLAEASGLYDLDWKRALERVRRRPPARRARVRREPVSEPAER